MAWFAGSAASKVPALFSLGLSILVLGPLLGPGHLLLRDAVSTPRSYFTDFALGTTDAAARAVPRQKIAKQARTTNNKSIVATFPLNEQIDVAKYPIRSESNYNYAHGNFVNMGGKRPGSPLHPLLLGVLR